MDLGTIQYNVEANTSDLDKANAAVDQMADNAQKAGVQVDQFGKKITDAGKKATATGDALKATSTSANEASKSITGFGSSAGRAGIQVQQFVGQIQGGQNAFVALSQQAADIGFVLGAPLAGVIVSLGAVIAGTLLPSLFKSGEAVKEVSDLTKELIKDFKDFTAAQKEVVNRGVASTLANETEKLKQKRDEIDANTEALEKQKIQYDKIFARGAKFEETKAFTKFNDELVKSQLEALEIEKKIKELQDPTGASKKIKNLADEAAITGAVGRAYWELKASQEGVADTRKEEYINAGLSLDKKKEDIKATEELKKETEQNAKASEQAEKSRLLSIKNLSEQYEKSIASLKEMTRVEKLDYDIARGLIKVKDGLVGAEYKHLKALAETADALDLQKDLYKEIEESIKTFSSTLDESFGADIMKDAESASKAIEESFGKAEKFSEDAAERINGAFSDAWVSVIDDAENAFDAIGDAFKRILAEMAHEAFTKPIVLNIQQSINGGGSGLLSGVGGAGLAVAGAIGIMGLVNSWNKRQEEAIKKLTAEYRQGTQSTGTLLGDANTKSQSIANSIASLESISEDGLDINRAMLSALNDIRDGIGKASAIFGRTGVNAPQVSGLGVSSGSAIDSVLKTTGLSVVGDIIGGQVGEFIDGIIGSVSKAIYSKTKKVIDTGIQFTGQTLADILATGTVDAMSYASVQTKKKFIGITTSNKVKDQFSDLDDALTSQFALVFGSAGDALEQAAGVFGLDFQNYINQLIIDPQKLSLKDLKGDELTKEIESFFSATLDNWAGVLVDGTGVLEKFQNVGEGAFETVVRLATELNSFNHYADLLGLNFKLSGFAAVEANQNIIDFAGGIDSLNASLSGYYRNFFTEQERADKQMAMLAEQFKVLGYDSVPATREAFKGIVESLDLATEAGQKQFAALMNLQGVFADLVPATEAATNSLKAMQNAASTAFDLLERSVSAERDRIEGIVSGASTAKDALDKAIGAQKSALSDAHNKRIDEIHALAEAESAQAKAQFEAEKALAKARVDAIKDEHDAVQDRIKGLQSLFGDLNDAVFDMAIKTDTVLRSRRRAAEFEIETALRNAQAGRGLPGAGQLDSALSILKENPSALYSSAQEMAHTTASLQNKIAALADITGDQLTTEEKTLSLLEQQLAAAQLTEESLTEFVDTTSAKYDKMIEQADLQYQSDVAALDAISKNAQDQYDLLTGIDTSTLSVEDAIVRYNEAILAADFTNAQEQYARLDRIVEQSQSQLNALLSIDDRILSLNDGITQFIDAISGTNDGTNQRMLEQMQAMTNEISVLRSEQQAQARSQQKALNTTAKNTTELVYA